MASRGTWNIGPINLPDFGWTEKVASPGNTTFYNPQVNYDRGLSSSGFQSALSGGVAGGGGGGGSIGNGTPTNNNQTTNNQGSPPPSGTSSLNPDLTYITRNNETKKLRDWMNEGVLDQNGNERRSSGGGAPDLDAIYNPLFSQLGQYEGQARSDYETQQRLLNEEQEKDLQALKQNQQLTNQNIESQKQVLEGEKQGALAEAIQQFNRLNQSGMSKFGRGSSAGEAIADISRSEYYKQSGNLRRTYEKEFDTIRKWSNQADMFYLQTDSDIRMEYKKAFQSAYSQYQDSINKINSQRSSLQSQRAQQQYAAKQQFESALQQIEANRQAQAYALDLWKEQVRYQLEMKVKDINDQAYTSPNGVFDEDVINPFTSNQIQGTTQSSIKRPGKYYDEFSQTDPFNTSTDFFNSYTA